MLPDTVLSIWQVMWSEIALQCKMISTVYQLQYFSDFIVVFCM